jgi:ribosomal subunit interface protein
MNVEYTGRQFEITPTTRKQVEGGLEKIQKILGSNFEAHVILSVAKRRHIAEITIAVRNHPSIVGLSEAAEMATAIGGALDRIERQSVKYKTRWKSKKRQARKKLESSAEMQEETSLAVAVGGDLTTAVPVKVHNFPAVVKVMETHVVKSSDSVSYKPLTLGGRQGSRIPRSRGLCLSRSAGPCKGAASQARWQDGVDRSALIFVASLRTAM